MVNKNRIIKLSLYEFKNDWRQQSALNGIFLYVFSAIFTVYLAVKFIPSPPLWNAVFWVVLLFSSLNAIAKSFLGESKAKHLYFHQMASASELIVAKIIYNAVLNLIVSTLCFSLYILILGNQIESIFYFLFIVLLGSIGFSSVFTLLSAIASKAGNGHVLMPILSFPVIIPFLLILIKSSKKALDGIDTSLIYNDLIVLGLFNIILIALAVVLFPFLWKE